MSAVNGTTLLNQYSLEHLNLASDNFKNNDRTRGFQNFEKVYPTHQYKVYEQIWIDRGKPEGDLFYGENVFKDRYGKYSTNQEKSVAIDGFVNKINQKIQEEGQRMQADLRHRTDPEKYDYYGNFTPAYIDKGFKSIDNFGKKMPAVPPECEKVAQVVVIGTASLAFGVLVIDAFRKMAGH